MIEEQSSIEWYCPGHSRELRWLDEDEVRGIHWAIAKDFEATPDPIKPAGVRNEDLLASAVFRPQTSLGGTLKYSTVEASAAALLCALIHDHPFIIGNKRTALVSMLVFLDENGFIPMCDEDDLFKLVLQVAQHRVAGTGRSASDQEVLAVAHWLHDCARPVESGDHPIKFRTLRAILTSFRCSIEFASSGNRMNITRRVKRKRWLRQPRDEILRTQVAYHGEGREVTKKSLKHLRESLHLDEDHGVDSMAFYGAAGDAVTDFIAEYRKTLRRLAKL